MSLKATSAPVLRLPRGRPSAKATAAKMGDVLRIAREQFVRQGYSSTTMDEIAAATGVTKRTLYQWYGDKAALFRACIIKGAERFPLPDIDSEADVETALCDYATALMHELAGDYSLGMGLLLAREGREFPEFSEISRQAYDDYLICPLADYLRSRGLEGPDSNTLARLLAVMIQAPLYEHLLSGIPLLTGQAIERHAALAVRIFLAGNPLVHAADLFPVCGKSGRQTTSSG